MKFVHKFNLSFVFHFYVLGIDVLDLNQPFNCSVEIREPFKVKLIGGR